MKRLSVWFNKIIKKRRELKRWQRVVTILAAIITFATTYALILPAITVEVDKTDEVDGMYLEQEEAQDEMIEENAVSFAYVADDMDAAAETHAEIPDYDVSREEDAPAGPWEADGEAAPAVKTLRAEKKEYTVVLTYDETSGIPDGAYLTASEIASDSIEYGTYLEEAKKAMGFTEEETLPHFAARFFDIKIMVGDDEFTPESGVSVEITYEEPLAEEADAEVSAVHFADEAADAEVIEANTTEIQDDGAATVEFTAESFSVYGVIYTMDFHWEVDGKMYRFSIPGGGYVSLAHVVEVLGICNSLEISEETGQFIANVEKVEFSNPELVWVGKVNNEITVGELKEANNLHCRYSAELDEEQIEEINAQTVEAGDWALISILPFTTDENLTVTMKTGEMFTIQMTDAMNLTAPYEKGTSFSG